MYPRYMRVTRLLHEDSSHNCENNYLQEHFQSSLAHVPWVSTGHGYFSCSYWLTLRSAQYCRLVNKLGRQSVCLLSLCLPVC